MNQETLLQKYLQGKLAKTEQQEFDALLKSDPEFRNEVEFHSDVNRAISAEEDEKFMKILSDFESEAREKKTEISKFPTKWLVAASIALLVGITYFFTTYQNTTSHDLYVQNFKPYRNVTHPIIRGDQLNDIKTQAFSEYNKGEYKKSVQLFTELYASEKEPYYLFYKANALIQLDRAEEAVPLLNKHLETQDSLTNKTYWYLAMAYLQLDDMVQAKQALNSVVERNAYNAQKAKQLLDAL
ncbi:hypothetical protein Q4566_14765 [Tamlana sp. 2_MG-2023]|uniref:tetratricopeptide repeat protein n=1 Tax=unclassified Tamlana TaxID=2614803 RepID=UPI0026E3D922|nr:MULTISPECIES: hypothetical protein [unclassified Tamlana]MDO6761471.1 hypothetical protein [Tamlana sp. 2_MG-2023]MDO6792354.1 hypothetical protein [Tamlana sp. 1_MG-2023]